MAALSHEALTPPEPEKTLDLFWDTWGEKTGLERGRLNHLWNGALRHYDESQEQHNFGHAVDVLWRGMELADLCEQNGLEVNRKILVLALLYHDAGYHLDHTTEGPGYGSKEEFSADICAREAPAYQYDDEEIKAAKTLILATGPGVKLEEPLQLEKIIMVRADIHNVGQDYSTEFKPTTLRLVREEIIKCQKARKALKAGRFVMDSIGYLGNYLSNDLRLGSSDSGEWQNQARSNVMKLLDELAKKKSSVGKENIEDLEVEQIIEVLGA
jgi:hypothetical protein